MSTVDREDEGGATRGEKTDVELAVIAPSISAATQHGQVGEAGVQIGGLATLSDIKHAWNARSLGLTWAGAIALSFVVAYDQNTYSSFAPYATSNFSQLSLLGTIGTIQGIVSAGMRRYFNCVYVDLILHGDSDATASRKTCRCLRVHIPTKRPSVSVQIAKKSCGLGVLKCSLFVLWW